MLFTNSCLVGFESTVTLLEQSTGATIAKSQVSIANRIRTRPHAVVVYDTFNNPFYPIDYPKIDSAKFDLPKIALRFWELYNVPKGTMLPWHYVIEFIGDRYYALVTRPIDLRFPDPGVAVDELKHYDVGDIIHIAVIGDSNIDVYTKQFYQVLTEFCINPILRRYRLPEIVGKTVIFLRPGKRMNVSAVQGMLGR